MSIRSPAVMAGTGGGAWTPSYPPWKLLEITPFVFCVACCPLYIEAAPLATLVSGDGVGLYLSHEVEDCQISKVLCLVRTVG